MCLKFHIYSIPASVLINLFYRLMQVAWALVPLLSQRQEDGFVHPIAHTSKSLNSQEKHCKRSTCISKLDSWSCMGYLVFVPLSFR